MTAAADDQLFKGRTVLIMIAVGVLAFAGLAVLSVYAPSLRSGNDGGGHSLSKSAVGFGGAVKLFRALGDPVIVSRGDTPGIDRAGLMIVTPSPAHDARAIRSVAFDGRRLVVLPKWMVVSHPVRPGWVLKGDALPVEALEKKGVLEAYARTADLQRRAGVTRPTLQFADGRTVKAGPVDQLQTFQADGLVALVSDDQGDVILARTRDRKTYILSDPDLLNTMGLRSLDTARAADAMLDLVRPEGPLIFDVSLHGFKRSRNLLALALEPPFLGGTLCLVAAALLAGIGAAIRFGPVRRAAPPYAMGKGALVVNTAGLIRMARREHRMAEGYARLCRDLAARAVGAPRQLEPAQLDAFLDRLSVQRGAPLFTDLITAARNARGLVDLMAVTRKLYDWRLEMTRASH
ncbi:MAG: hypothetical protein Q8J89_03955 [Caulobacter sp.]|nr:hypothetical protein [Caulobacter sp.]